MLCNSTKIKCRIIRNFNENIRLKAKQKSTLVQNINKYFVFEGDKLGTKRTDGSKTIAPIQKIEVNTIVHKNELGPDTMSKVMDDLSSQIANEQSKLMIEVLNESVEVTGNKVDGNGKPPSPEMMLQLLEKIDIDFLNELPKLPKLICHPSSLDKMKQAIDNMMLIEPHKTNYEKLIKRKREDFHEREARRKLVD